MVPMEEALSSETRRDILRLLSEKNHRPSDLSRELGKDKSTIAEHLETLEQAGLVDRIEREGHKWVFYSLSPGGQAYFPNRRKRVIFLGLSMVSLAGAVISALAYMQQPFGAGEAQDAGGAAAPMLAADAKGAAEAVNESVVQPARGAMGNDVYLYAGIALFTVFLVALAQFLLTKGGELVIPKKK